MTHTLARKLKKIAAITAIFLLAATPQHALAADDPNLAQSVATNENISHDTVAISRGHVDVGPRFINNEWTAMARHDAENGPTWYDLDNVIIQVVNAAQLPAPEGEDYAFMGDTPHWYVIPQTENPNVTWLGWNTQDPQITHDVKRGVTMTIGHVDGPGRAILFLQDGTFGKPRVLADSSVTNPHDIWIDVNTHVHANWAFSTPGIYRAPVTFTAETSDGRTLTESATLRFAVGDDTNPADALALPALDPVPAGQGHANSLNDATDNTPTGTTSPRWPLALIIGVAVAIGGGILGGRNARSRREAAQAQAEHHNTHGQQEPHAQ